MAPVAYMLGVPWEDCRAVGKLLGTRTVLNELIAFSDLGELKDKGILIDRSVVIASFALCGFANISSIGIQLGGIGALAPERRHDLARLGVASPVRRDAGQLPLGLHRGDLAMTTAATFLEPPGRPLRSCSRERGGPAHRLPSETPRVAVVLGSGLNELAGRRAGRHGSSRTSAFPISRCRPSPGMPASPLRQARRRSR